ncbi:MAG: serine hydrolase domain-containing protein [Spirochaetales bacterium]
MTIEELQPVLDCLFEAHRVLNRSAHLSWGVVNKGVLVASGGHAADATTRFGIASMTKSFTASAVLRLRDSGQLRLDDPLVRYAPELATLTGPDDSPPLTIRHLLTQASGLATDDPWADRHMGLDNGELDLLLSRGAVFATVPGAPLQYSNLAYAVLGRIAHRVGGRSLQRQVTEEFLGPLGMDSTSWRLNEDYSNSALAPLGGLHSTVEDLARWIGFFSAAWPSRAGEDGLPHRRSTRREMQQGATPFPPEPVTMLDGRRWVFQGAYGMGLIALHHDAIGPVTAHSGGLPGWGCSMRWVPGSGVGVVALADSTYARMGDATVAALELLHAHGQLATPAPEVPEELRRIGLALLDLLADFSPGAADLLFAENVLPDESFEVRSAKASELVRRHGRLTAAGFEGISGAEARLVVRGQLSHDTVKINFQVSSVLPLRIQYYQWT